MATTKVIDISKWQGGITVAQWDDIKSKCGGVILRAGLGNTHTQKDSRFEEYYSVCEERSIPVGAYWYSYARSVDEARREADACIKVLDKKKFQFPIYYDMEDNTIANLGKQQLTEQAIAFCSKLESAGYFVGIYANTNWLLNYLDTDRLKKMYTIWLADYRSVPNTVLPRDMWQFSSTNAFNILGFGEHLDCNYCYREFPTVIKRAGLNNLKTVVKTEPVEVVQGEVQNKLYKIVLTVSSGDKNKILELCDTLQLSATVEVV